MPYPTQMWELARIVTATRDCPTCGEPAGYRCRSLRDKDRAVIAAPHPARYPAGNTLQREPANAALLPERTP